MAGYVRQSAADIVPTAVVRAAPINNELNALRDAFAQATGHKHDGTSAEGHYIPVIGDADAKNKIAVDTTNNRHGVFVEVSGTSTEQVRFQDGAIVPVTDNDVDLGTSSLEFKDLFIDGTANIDSLIADTADINAGTIDNTVVGATTPAAATVTTLNTTGDAAVAGNLVVTGNATVNGNTVIGNATSDTVTVTARVSSSLVPTNDNTSDLGTSLLEWKDLFIDGTATIDTLLVDENATVTGNASVGGTLNVTGQATLANVNATGGVINNTVIGGSTPAAITGTTVTANTGFVGNVTGNVTGNLTGNVTASSGGSTFNNVTVNGTIDVTNTVIANVATPVLNTDAATKGYVDTVINNLIDSSPGTLDTLNEIAAALGDDPNFAATMTTELAKKLDKTGGTMTGAIAMSGNKITGLGTPTTGTDAATKAYIDTTFGDTASAASSAAAAAASAAAAAASYDSFDDRYLGAKSSSPTLDNDGNALITGALYFDTTSEKMKVYTGTSWVDAGSAVNGTAERYVYTATASQTTFAVTYDVGFVDVYLNGVKLVDSTDFTATNGTTVVLATGATTGDIVDIVAYGAFSVANTYTQAAADAKFLDAASNLSDLASASTARTNLGLGTAAVMAGPSGTIVGTTDSQTLTNKTITFGSNTLTDVASINTAQTFTGTKTFAGTSSTLAMVLNDAGETATVTATAATGTIAYDVTTQSVLFYTSNASANWTVNFRASSGTSLNTVMAIGQSVTAAFLVTQGATAYFNSAVQVDGTTSGVTTRWQGGTAPAAGNASGVDIYTYTIIKTANATFSVFAAQTRFA